METAYFGIFPLAFLASFLLSSGLTPLIINLAKYWGITDNPQLNERKIHDQPIPLLGGWSIFLASSVVILLIKYFSLANFSIIPNSLFWAVIVASLILIIGGSLDDKFNLKPYQQIIFPLIAVALVLFFGLKIDYVTNPLGGVFQIKEVWGVVIAGFWLLGMMYTTKFLDGLDGLATGIGAIAAIFIFLISLKWDVFLSATGVWGLVFAGACLGFLVYNRQPARIFLGEGGSVLIGFILGVLSIISGSKIVTTLLVMGLPILDVLLVIIRRLMEGKSPFSGDRNHLHYRLLSLGLGKKQVVWVLYFLALFFGLLGLLSSSYLKMILAGCLFVIVIALSWFLKIKSKK